MKVLSRLTGLPAPEHDADAARWSDILHIGTTAPSVSGTQRLWWHSEEGDLYVLYDDGDSAQWVAATVPVPGPEGPPADIGAYLARQTLTDGATVTQDVELGVNAYWAPGATRTLAVPVAGAGQVPAGVTGTIWIQQSDDGWGINLGGPWLPLAGDPIASFADGNVDTQALLSWISVGGGVFAGSFLLFVI
jgi:hypothetical protein